MDQQQQYVGLDVSLETTAICVIDDKGAVVWRGKCASTPESITAAVRQHAPAAIRVGLETGQLSNWLTLNLRPRGVHVVCLDARHAKAALSLQITLCAGCGVQKGECAATGVAPLATIPPRATDLTSISRRNSSRNGPDRAKTRSDWRRWSIAHRFVGA
jgi:hypothetical protein